MRTAIFVTSLLLTISGGDVFAQNIRTTDLMAHCTVSSGGPDDYCKGFLNGFADAAGLYQLTALLQSPRPIPPGNVPPFCLLSSDSDEDLAGAVVEYVRANPGKADDFAATTVLEALSTRYPCKR
jgi:hypothetical protein